MPGNHYILEIRRCTTHFNHAIVHSGLVLQSIMSTFGAIHLSLSVLSYLFDLVDGKKRSIMLTQQLFKVLDDFPRWEL